MEQSWPCTRNAVLWPVSSHVSPKNRALKRNPGSAWIIFSHYVETPFLEE